MEAQGARRPARANRGFVPPSLSHCAGEKRVLTTSSFASLRRDDSLSRIRSRRRRSSAHSLRRRGSTPPTFLAVRRRFPFLLDKELSC